LVDVSRNEGGEPANRLKINSVRCIAGGDNTSHDSGSFSNGCAGSAVKIAFGQRCVVAKAQYSQPMRPMYQSLPPRRIIEGEKGDNAALGGHRGQARSFWRRRR
jgi:hypothetical protein